MIVQVENLTVAHGECNGWHTHIVYGHPRNENHTPTAWLDIEMLTVTGPSGEVGTLDRESAQALVNSIQNKAAS